MSYKKYTSKLVLACVQENLCSRCADLRLFCVHHVLDNSVYSKETYTTPIFICVWSKMIYRKSTANSQPPHGKHTMRSTWTQKLRLCWNTIFLASKTHSDSSWTSFCWDTVWSQPKERFHVWTCDTTTGTVIMKTKYIMLLRRVCGNSWESLYCGPI